MSQVTPSEGEETISFVIGLRPLKGTMSPAVVADLPLEVILSPMVDCFSGPWHIGEAF